MSEVVLLLVIVVLCGFIGYDHYLNRKEREKLMKMIMSRNAQDLANLELADKVTEINPNPTNPFLDDEDLVSVEGLNDKEFKRHVLDQREEDEN